MDGFQAMRIPFSLSPKLCMFLSKIGMSPVMTLTAVKPSVPVTKLLGWHATARCCQGWQEDLAFPTLFMPLAGAGKLVEK